MDPHPGGSVYDRDLDEYRTPAAAWRAHWKADLADWAWMEAAVICLDAMRVGAAP